jgi:hypothetical protein
MSTESVLPTPTRVVLLHKRGATEDEQLAHILEKDLIQAGCTVFVDRQTQLDLDWARGIGEQLKTADVVVAIVSEHSVQSEIFATELETAHETAQAHVRPKIIGVHVGTVLEIPEPIDSILSSAPRIQWNGLGDTAAVSTEVVQSVRELPVKSSPLRVSISKGLRLSPRTTPAVRPVVRVVTPATTPTTPAWQAPLEPPGGAVPLHSEFYVERASDKELRNALIRYDSIVLLKGARQMGKTSMLARGLQFARERGARVALTDFQKFNATNLESVGPFYLSLAESLADQLELGVLPSDTWDERRGPNVNFERFVRREVLAKLNAPLVWGLDEVDRLFTTAFGSEVFGLFRSWHNERALDPSGPWAGLSLCIAYATEAHLFITDMNQSPFNVGTRLALDDFTLAKVSELNQRYGSPLKDPTELDGFFRLMGGHPFLTRRGLHELANRRIGFDVFSNQAANDDGIYGEHLRRILVLLAKDPVLTEVVRSVLRGQACPTPESFYRLRSAGVITGNSMTDCKPRCELYATYLKRHLL